VITHLPVAGGYHKDRLNVIKASLESMRDNAGNDDFQTLVWDNGSCDQLTHWLKRSYQPDFLITGPNLGKTTARKSTLEMLPPDTIVGCADDDMFYYPGWLNAHLEVMNTYPKVGTVSGWPVRTQHRFANNHTIAWAERAAKIEVGRFISDQEDRDFCSSIGREYDWHKDYSAGDKDVRITYRGVQVYGTGHHCQFIGKAGTLAKFEQFSAEAMRPERYFEEAIDRAGLLRLTTYKRYTRHIGNVLDKELEDEWQKLR
jgi:glycosyltransferase involved in cell wall biosynthesis